MSPKTKSYQSLRKLQTVCLKQSIPFASYRLPLHPDIITLVQHQSLPERIDSLNGLGQKSGFVMAPFFETERHHSLLLKPESIFLSDNIDPAFINELSRNSGFQSAGMPSGEETTTTPPTDFIQQVNDAKRAISEKRFHKVVLSKVRKEELSIGFEASTFFLQLCATYPHAFVYIIQLPEAGCWIGATPEPLLLLEAGKAKTVSLAGTQVATSADISSYRWSEKEIEEQGIVTGYMEQTLQALQIDNYTLTGPSNYKAANLVHLKTGFEFSQADMGNRLGDFLKAFHPTPSVGGLPKEAARDFILENEKHDRSYYTGYLGPVNIENKSNVFVNLRCLQLFQKQFVLYSGAGITASSIAEKEWEETDNKMMTMMNVMQNPNN
ncbi:MAG: isochorismate synthase [Bacteroidota bacterium]|nr:isochorismate synthase [Bacteroidota bacterium]